MPAPGCRGDVKPVAPDGSYVAAPAAFPTDDNRLRVEACLAAPSEDSGSDSRRRLRVVATLMQDWQSHRWQLVLVDVHKEL